MTIYNCLKSDVLADNLTKDVQDLYIENCKVLLTEIKEDLNGELYCAS